MSANLTSEEQLERWVEGESLCPNEYGDCCPDFSCCVPSLLVDKDARVEFTEAYAQGDNRKVEHMCLMFLGAALGALDRRDEVYLAGLDGGAEES